MTTYFWCITLMLYTLSGALRIREVGGRSPALGDDPDTALTFRSAIDRAVADEIDKLAQEDVSLQRREPAPLQMTLLTSLFLRDETTSAHYDELMGALAVNVHNHYISDIHVLLEAQSTGISDCDKFLAMLEQVSKTSSRKVVCEPVPKQPTYHDFFVYANTTLKDTNVLLANTDIAFDTSLSLIDLAELTHRAEAMTPMGYVFSVQPPPYAGEYRARFGMECGGAGNPSRCTVGLFDGWRDGGDSWDAYLFRSPLPAMDASHLDHVMNTGGGENRAAYQLEVTAGVKLFNPCKHVHAFHWHCIGGKMHGDARMDFSDDKNCKKILPCWDCPGVAYPAGLSPSASLCLGGTLQAIELPEVQRLFQNASHVHACLQHGMTESMLLDKWRKDKLSVNICHSSTDIDCFVAKYGALDEHEYYQGRWKYEPGSLACIKDEFCHRKVEFRTNSTTL